ncbi:MAG TPA: GtrA family protein [Bacteroidales bacterium]|nr:GtrA family protein [Bacteroidales bacterium]HPS16033.1 GtrA family protein [Bacteroidales bacterium]
MFSFLSEDNIYKFIKFGVVGCSGMVIDFGLTYLFKEIVKIQKYIANTIGFCTAATTNFFLNRIWTFHSTDPAITYQFCKFFFISLIGLGINTFVLWILVSKYNKNFYLSKLFAIGIVLIWNFFINLYFTF